jgi:hypothetical protein
VAAIGGDAVFAKTWLGARKLAARSAAKRGLFIGYLSSSEVFWG